MIAENALSGRNSVYKLCLGKGNYTYMTSMFVTNIYVLLFKIVMRATERKKNINKQSWTLSF